MGNHFWERERFRQEFSISRPGVRICLPMELLKRLLPGLNLSLAMQGLNVLFSAVTAGALAALCRVIFSQEEARAAVLLYVLFLPLALQCIFVYGTLPMLMMTALAVLCFALYLKRRRVRFGLAYAVCMALAYMLKPNAAVPLIALAICAVLDVPESRDWRLPGFAALSVVLSVGLARLVIAQYELRAGVTLTGDVSMLARMVMGLQRGGAQAGWFNRYTEQFFPLDVTAAQERAIASADLAARLAELRAVYYEGLQREQTGVRTLRHDLRNHLTALRGLLERGETGRALDYLDRVADAPALRGARRFCENETAASSWWSACRCEKGLLRLQQLFSVCQRIILNAPVSRLRTGGWSGRGAASPASGIQSSDFQTFRSLKIRIQLVEKNFSTS